MATFTHQSSCKSVRIAYFSQGNKLLNVSWLTVNLNSACFNGSSHNMKNFRHKIYKIALLLVEPESFISVVYVQSPEIPAKTKKDVNARS